MVPPLLFAPGVTSIDRLGRLGISTPLRNVVEASPPHLQRWVWHTHIPFERGGDFRTSLEKVAAKKCGPTQGPSVHLRKLRCHPRLLEQVGMAYASRFSGRCHVYSYVVRGGDIPNALRTSEWQPLTTLGNEGGASSARLRRSGVSTTPWNVVVASPSHVMECRRHPYTCFRA